MGSPFRKNIPFFLKRLFLLILFSAAPENFVRGQEFLTFRSELDFVRNQVDWRLGPFKVHPLFELDLGYDDNIYSTPESIVPVKDYVATITPQFTFYLPYSDWLIMSFREIPQYVFYFDTPEERAFNNGFVPALRLLLFRSWALSGTYQRLRSKLRVSLEIDRRIFQEIEGQSGSLFYETARGTAVGVVAEFNRLRYEATYLPDAESSVAEALDREEVNGRAEFYYRILAEGDFFANFGYTEYNFSSPESRFRDTYSFQANVGVRFPLMGETRGVLSLGYKKLVPRSPGLKGYAGLVGHTNLSFRRSRFGFRFFYIRDTPFSYSDSIYFLDTRVGPGISFYLSRSIRLDYDFSYGRGDYPETFFLPSGDSQAEEIARQDLYQSHAAAVVIRLVQDIGVGLRAQRWERTSNFGQFNVSRLFLGLYLTYEF